MAVLIRSVIDRDRYEQLLRLEHWLAHGPIVVKAAPLPADLADELRRLVGDGIDDYQRTLAKGAAL